jgi:hypothetical protein
MSSKLSALEKQALQSVASSDGWDRIAQRIKTNHGGNYPSDWFEVVLKPGGILEQAAARGCARPAQAITADSWDELLAKLDGPKP